MPKPYPKAGKPIQGPRPIVKAITPLITPPHTAPIKVPQTGPGPGPDHAHSLVDRNTKDSMELR